MSKSRQILVGAVLAVGILGSTIVGITNCSSPAYYMRSANAASDVVSVAKIDQKMLDEAWQEALKVGKGNPVWPLSVPLVRVVYVPSTLAIGRYQYYGITVTEPAIVDGKLVLVETIEIHLPNNLACHLKQVLIHELLHTVATRRELTDKTFPAEVMAAGNEEAWVRTVYPINDMGVCQ